MTNNGQTLKFCYLCERPSPNVKQLGDICLECAKAEEEKAGHGR